ncbi:MAG TPA: ABC transporter permease [Gaiellaceae bacterium]|jgi:ABC-type branched-subunit amino acid transport system permease subunit
MSLLAAANWGLIPGYTVIGVTLGGIYALAAIGLVLIYRVSGVLNFAQGAVSMFSAFVAYEVSTVQGAPGIVGLVAAIVAGGAIGYLIERFTIRPLAGRSALNKVVVTIGWLLVLQTSAALIWGNTAYHAPVRLLPTSGFVFPGTNVVVGWDEFVTIAVALILAFGTAAVMRWTTFGTSMRAVADDPEAARLWGINVNRVMAVSWIAGSSMGAIAGVLITPRINFDPLSLTIVVIYAFTAALIGRLTSLPWTVAGAFLLGLAQTYPRIFSTNAGAGDAVTFALVLVTLGILFRPSARLRHRIVAGREYLPVPATGNAPVRRGVVATAIGLGILCPLAFSGYYLYLSAEALIVGLIVLSLVILTGLVGQISFCQYSFAAIGACTVGSLVGGHGWSFWPALAVGVAASIVVGMLVGIPALRLSGLFLGILTIAVALFFDNFLLAPGTWSSFSGGISSWTVSRPSFLGASLNGGYAFYLFSLGVFGLASLAVWNLSRSKTGRVLRAIRNSEIAAATSGVNLTLWKLAAFGLSAGFAGLAGGLIAPLIGSVSVGAFSFQQSLTVVAIAVVVGVRSVAAGVVGGVFLIFGPELLTHTPLSSLWFPLIVGAVLIVQVIVTPQGLVPDWQERFRKHFPPPARFPQAPPLAALAGVAPSEQKTVVKV